MLDKNILIDALKYRILKLEGEEFQNFFGKLMKDIYKIDYEEMPTKRGDGGNDGFIISEGKFFALYSPKSSTAEHRNFDKVRSDFEKLINGKYKDKVKEWVFVYNDKFDGEPRILEEIEKIEKYNSNIKMERWLMAEVLDLIVNRASETFIESIQTISLSDIREIDLKLIKEIVNFCLKEKTNHDDIDYNVIPFRKKIEFNKINEHHAKLLSDARSFNNELQRYFDNNNKDKEFDLSYQMKKKYRNAKEKYPNNENYQLFYIMQEMSPNNDPEYQKQCLIIIAKYFESCDIFEKIKEDK
jgi:hypothetical protein